MAKKVSASCVEVGDELPEDKQQQKGTGIEITNDSNGKLKLYQTLDQEQRCGSPQYQEIISWKHNKSGEDKAPVVSQPSKDEVDEPTGQGTVKEPFMEKPPSHLVLAISSLFTCIFCWPAAPCAVLATIYATQVGELWEASLYKKAKSASDKTKELAITALVCGGINAIVCFAITLTSALVVLRVYGYLSLVD